MRADHHWQAKENFSATNFRIDWQKQQAICPEEKISSSWTPAIDGRRKEVIKIKFSTSDCGPCSSRHLCTKTKSRRRTLTIRPQAQHEALSVDRAREQTAEYQDLYRQRAWSKGTISQGTRVFGLQRSRYIGIAKTHLQHLTVATAINFVRLANWLAGLPTARTRQPVFARVLLQEVGAT